MAILLFIGDEPDQFRTLENWVERESVWQDTRPVTVTGHGSVLMEMAKKAVNEYFSAKTICDGGIILDLNWGRGLSTCGCEFVHWLRLAGYRQPVVLRSDYVTDSRTLSPLVAAQLPAELGWYVLTDDILDEGLPRCLSDEQAVLARSVASELAHRTKAPATISAIRQEAAGKFYGGTVDWEAIERWAASLGGLDVLKTPRMASREPRSSAGREAEWKTAHEVLIQAISQRNAKVVIEAVTHLETLNLSQ